MTRIGLALLLFVSLPALAAPRGGPMPFNDRQGRSIDSIHIPPRSPVRFGEWLKGPVAQFNGRFILTGTYYYGDSEHNHGKEFVGEAHIIPDPNADLPQLVKRVGGLQAIRIDNPESFAEAVVPQGELQTVRHKGGGYATGHVAVRVSGYTVGIACDSPSYGTHFLALYRPFSVRMASAPPHTGC